EDGQLLGNEEVSTDGESWSAIGAHPAFAGAIQKLVESPTRSGAAGTSSAPPAPTPEPATKSNADPRSMERLKQLYEGRMAAVTVVDRAQASAKFKKRLPLLIAAAAGVLVLCGGASLGWTKFGFFGVRKLFPRTVRPDTEGFKKLSEARARLLAD